MIRQFDVVSGLLGDVNDEVNKRLNEGWELAGAMFVRENRSPPEPTYYQPIRRVRLENCDHEIRFLREKSRVVDRFFSVEINFILPMAHAKGADIAMIIGHEFDNRMKPLIKELNDSIQKTEA